MKSMTVGPQKSGCCWGWNLNLKTGNQFQEKHFYLQMIYLDTVKHRYNGNSLLPTLPGSQNTTGKFFFYLFLSLQDEILLLFVFCLHLQPHWGCTCTGWPQAFLSSFKASKWGNAPSWSMHTHKFSQWMHHMVWGWAAHFPQFLLCCHVNRMFSSWLPFCCSLQCLFTNFDYYF